jgi:dihydroorotate dehydrogenase electron transfer subunit
MEKSKLHWKATVIRNAKLCVDHFRLVLRCDAIARTTRPGQFVNLRIAHREDLLLRRPFSVAMTQPERSTFDIVYRVVGQGTKAMAKLRRGEMVDLLGPLGTGFHLPETSGTYLLLGGGCGVAPLWALADHLHQRNNGVIALIGFQSSDKVFGEGVFRKLKAETIVTTDDGSYGLKGFVSDHLEEVFKRSIDRAYVCGPEPMLKVVIPMIRKARIKGEVSLEERMGCGYGVCLSCVANIARDGVVERLRICKEGPVFDLEEILLDDQT